MVITKAAIMFQNGEVLEGHSYGEISILGNKLSLTGLKIHGFLTSSDVFVLPSEGALIAFEAGQISEKTENLTPEMLWPYIKENE